MQELADEHSWVRGIDLMRNYGQHNALLCGIRVAQQSGTVTMEDDLQGPPERTRVKAHGLHLNNITDFSVHPYGRREGR